MNAKKYILSLAAIAVIGCGGSNSGACCTGGLSDGIAKGEGTFKAQKDGTVNAEVTIKDSDGNNVGTVLIKKASNVGESGSNSSNGNSGSGSGSTNGGSGSGSTNGGSGSGSTNGGSGSGSSSNTVPACQTDCTITVIQESHCPKKPIANPILRYTKCYGKSALAYAERHAGKLNYDPTKQMIVYGGAILLQSDDFDIVDASLTVKGIDCGMEVRTEVPAGFSNPGHKVFALIKILDACGNDVKDSQWTKEVTIKEDGTFTLDLDGLEFGDDNQVEVLLFSIKDADKAGSTGSTGASS